MSDHALSEKAQLMGFQTFRHIETVRNFLNAFVIDLLHRGEQHDQTKLSPEEAEKFAEATPRLKALTYGSPEYDAAKAELGEALAHHYAKNSHHPEHHAGGINDMTLMDLVEMFCDWKAATLRHNDGNILKSIEHNANRFEMSPQLRKIFENTARETDRWKVGP